MSGLKKPKQQQTIKKGNSMQNNNTVQSVGFYRLPDIIGNAKANPPIKALYPVSRSTWFEGVRTGRYPKPVKLSERCSAWRIEDIHNLITNMGSNAQGGRYE
jgi:prophage regulatory protein